MTTSSTTDHVASGSKVVDIAERFKWEAPELRPIAQVEGDKPTPWAYPCPSWCDGKGAEHEEGAHVDNAGNRRHTSPILSVRVDCARPYAVEDGRGRTVYMDGNISAQLSSSSRAPQLPSIRMAVNYGNPDRSGRHATTYLARMFPDEVRELISVLQYLLKVGMED